MTIEEKIRDIVSRNFSVTIEGDEGGKIASEIIEDTTKELMIMLRTGIYI